MAEPEMRLLAAAISLETFTVPELSAAARSNPSTAKSWLRKYDHLFSKEETISVGRGRPRKILELLPEGRLLLERRLHEMQGHLVVASPQVDNGALLRGVTRQFELWKKAHSRGLPEADTLLAGLRVAVRDAWQLLTRLDAVGESVSRTVIDALAIIETEAGIVIPDPDFSMPQLARWLVARATRVVLQDGTEYFSERVTHRRLEARLHPERATAALLAAAVWSDEGMADSLLSEADWQRSLQIAELVPIDVRLERATVVLGDIDDPFCEDNGQAQAVVRGLTACELHGRTDKLRDWLGAAKGRNGWRDALAPVVVHGLTLCDDTFIGAATEPFRSVIESGVLEYEGVIGALRGEAFEKAQLVGCLSTVQMSASDFSDMADPFGSQMILSHPTVR